MSRWLLSGFGDEIDPDPIVQVAVLQALGARHIEVRSVWGTNIVDLTDDQLAELRRVLDGGGTGTGTGGGDNGSMRVSAIASPVGKVDIALPPEAELARLERAIRAAHVLDAPYIRLFSFYRQPEQSAAEIRDDVLVRMRAFARLAERERVTLVHENEKDIYGDVPERVLDIIESVGSPALRVAWDSANFVQVGVAPFAEAYPMLRPHLEYLQVKDAVAATGEVTPAGEGDGQLRETLAALRDDGYEGFASLEPHLGETSALGGFSGAGAFGVAALALRRLTDELGITLA